MYDWLKLIVLLNVHQHRIYVADNMYKKIYVHVADKCTVIHNVHFVTNNFNDVLNVESVCS